MQHSPQKCNTSDFERHQRNQQSPHNTTPNNATQTQCNTKQRNTPHNATQATSFWWADQVDGPQATQNVRKIDQFMVIQSAQEMSCRLGD